MDNKIWFAQMLRGIACLSVCYEHLFRRFWVDADFRSSVTKHLGLNLNIEDNFLIKINTVFNYLGGFNIGSFGVAIFFLISGFVIPFSIEKESSKDFIINRFFRIFPTYIASVFFSLTFLYLFNHHLTSNITDIIANLTLFPVSVLNKTPIDSVYWTLVVEFSFYLLMVLASKLGDIQQSTTLILTILSLTILPITIHNSGLDLGILAKEIIAFIVNTLSFYISFMMIGVCFYNLYIKKWSKKKFLSVLLFLYLLFLSQLWQLKLMFVLSYSSALIVFAACYFYQKNIKYNIVLDFFANISYPLYLNHSILGVILLITTLRLFPFFGAISCFITFVICISFAFIIHKYIERPFLHRKKDKIFLKNSI